MVVATLAALTAAFAWLLNIDGIGLLDLVILMLFAVTSIWNVIGFWNSVIGFILLKRGRSGLLSAAPHLAAGDDEKPIRHRTALVMAIRHEDMAPVIARLKAMEADLAQMDAAAFFDIHILSDSSRQDVAAVEEHAVANWRQVARAPQRIFYRRRAQNTGFKAGNIQSFCRECGNRYRYFLPLDADSLMSAKDILRLVRIMEACPQIGLLQSLTVGLPSPRFFTRFFQFGMRHGMRTYTTGSAWWQADCGPYWGHNALIRLKPFRQACVLPRLPGTWPLGGDILSHDQLEAALLRRAGYECRVLPIEGESYEENPPSFPEFTKRDLRWCQGSLQYLQLLNLPKLQLTSRIQLLLAVLMYGGSLGWMLFLALSALIANLSGLSIWLTGSPDAGGAVDGSRAFPIGLAIAFFVLMMLINLSPKIAGLIDVLSAPDQRAACGGTGRTILGFMIDFVFTLLLAPAMALSVSLFMVGLCFGKGVAWDHQVRAGHKVSWARAFSLYGVHSLMGIALGLSFWMAHPAFVAWGAPLLAGLIGAPAFAVFTAGDGPSRFAVRHKLGALGDETAPSDIIKRVRQLEEEAREVLKRAA